VTAGPCKQRHLTGMTSPNPDSTWLPMIQGTWPLHSSYCTPTWLCQEGQRHRQRSCSFPSPSHHPFLSHSYKDLRPNKQWKEINCPPPFLQKIPKVHLCYGIVLYIVSQTINHLRNRARAHTSTYHTLCWSLTLLYTVVMATPLREDTGCNSGEISPTLFYLSLFLSHTHLPFLSLPAISICLPPLLSLPRPLSFSSYPCITLGAPLCPPLSITLLPFHLLTYRLPLPGHM